MYEAQQISLPRRVALKVLPLAAALEPKQLARFQLEARAAALLQHTGIVPVYAVGCERGLHYYAMQFIEGPSLAEVVQKLRQRSADATPTASAATSQDSGAGAPAGASALAEELVSGLVGEFSTTDPGGPLAPLESHLEVALPADSNAPAGKGIAQPGSTLGLPYLRAVAHLGIQAAEALHHAHESGVIHRDIKPANLLIDSRAHLWITDFGLALFPDRGELTMTGDLLGTLRFMSPEQALGKPMVVDHRTDVYSLGATLYELLTLEPAVSGASRQQVLDRIAHQEPGLPRRVNPVIPRDLETIVLKAMAKERDARYNTAKKFGDDLRRFLNDIPILARRPSLSDRVSKWT